MRPRAERHVRRGTGALTDLRRADTPFHTARQLGPKKFAGNFGEYFPTAESTPNAALTGLGGADEPERAVFELKGAEFSRSGKSRKLSFSTRQTRSQARLNRLGSSSSPVVLRSCSLVIDDAALGTAATADACPVGQADFGAGCVVACPAGQVVSAGGDTCVAQKCCPSETQCAAGSICPGGTGVSAECADRSAFAENPCACTALQELAALSATLPTLPPWNDLANTAYCQDRSQEGSLDVRCATVGGVRLPTIVATALSGSGLAGALPPSLGELGPSLTYLGLGLNAITSVPTELGALTGLVDLELPQNAITSLPAEVGALTGLTWLDLSDNQLTGVPAGFRTVNPSDQCDLSGNPGFSYANAEIQGGCANVGAGTTCCDGFNNCGEGLPGGPCYTG